MAVLLLSLTGCAAAPLPPLPQEENMVSNKDIQDKYKDFADYEDDFM